jgi:hypothetical protein
MLLILRLCHFCLICVKILTKVAHIQTEAQELCLINNNKIEF